MTPFGKRIVGTRYGRQSSDVLTESAGDAIGHTAAERETCDVDAVCVNTILLFHITEKVTRELDIVGIASSNASIPGGRRFKALGEDEHEPGTIGFCSHIGIVLLVLCSPTIPVIIDDERLWLLPIGLRQGKKQGTLSSPRSKRLV